MPVLIYDFLQSARLLTNSVISFRDNCVTGIKTNAEKMRDGLERSLMLATALNPYIGYENSAAVVKKAYEEDLSTREACLMLGYMTGDEFDRVFRPEEMV